MYYENALFSADDRSACRYVACTIVVGGIKILDEISPRAQFCIIITNQVLSIKGGGVAVLSKGVHLEKLAARSHTHELF